MIRRIINNQPLLVVITFIVIHLANAQDDHGQHTPTSSNFQPSLFVVIGVLSFMFTLTSILLIYARFFYRQPSAIHSISQTQNTTSAMFGNHTRFSGIDKKVVESLPFFRFSSLKGSKQGLQCSVCLAEFEDVEILRLLPKCKHGFHIECVDLWLEHHSTCPLCRQIISAEDLTTFATSSSMRFIMGGERQKSDAGDAASSSSFKLFLERENSQQSSSRFSLGGSFRRVLSAKVEDEVHIQVDHDDDKVLHRLNHQIVVSDVVFKHRWSDVSSSDLMFLNSEMLGVMSSDRVISANMLNNNAKNSSDDENDEYRIINLRDEIERKKNFEDKVGQIKGCNSNPRLNIETGFEDLSGPSNMNSNQTRRNSMIPADKRSMSEITALSRFKDLISMKSKLRQCLADNNSDNNDDDDYVRDDLIKRRKKWFPIAKKTVQWFANREKNRSQLRQQQQQPQQSQETSQTSDQVKHRINQSTQQFHKPGLAT